MSARPMSLSFGFITSFVVAGLLQAAPVLEEVVVTAQKREQSLMDVPISVAVVDQGQIQASQVADTQDFVRLTPSLSFTRSFAASASSFAMRGISSFVQQGSIQPAVAVIVDGVALSRSAEFIMSLADVERIEVLRGPQGTLIGKNATAGALNIVTQRPEAEWRGEVSGSYTNDSEKILRAMVTGPFYTEAARYRINVFKREMDGFIENIHPVGRDQGGIDSQGVLAKFDIDLNEDMELRLSADYRDIFSAPQFLVLVPDTQLTQEFVDRNGFIPSFDDPKVNIDIDPENVDVGWGLSLDYLWSLSEGLGVRAITSYREFDTDSELDVDLGPETIKPTTVEAAPGVFIGYRGAPFGSGRAPISSYTFTQELRVEGSGAHYSYIAGAFYQSLKENAFLTLPTVIDLVNRPAAPGPNPIISLVHMTDSVVTDDTSAIFGDVTLDLTDSISLFAGARFTRETLGWRIVQMDLYDPDSESPLGVAQPFFEGAPKSAIRSAVDRIRANPKLYDLNSFQTLPAIVLDDEQTENKVTGRLGLIYRFSDEVSVYASVSTGFKGAGINASATATTPERALVDSEDAFSTELGLKGRFWDNRLSLNANVFSMVVENFQAAQLTPGTFNTEVINAGDIESAGVELEFTLAATDDLRLSGGVAYTDATLENFTNACYVGQDAADGCTIDSNGDGEGDTQDLSGSESPVTPSLKWHVAADYHRDLRAIPWGWDFRIAYAWQDKQQFNLQRDPLNANPAYGLWDASVNLSDRGGRYSVGVFGKNLTDERFYAAYGEIDGFIARAQAMPTRAAFRHWGIQARLAFD